MITTILLVDDEKDILVVLTELLEMEGFVILSALNGKSGFQLFQEFNPDLVITDMMMPILNGYEMIKLIREAEINSKVPIVVMSSVANLAKEHDPMWDYFIKKPCGIDDILNVVEKIIKK